MATKRITCNFFNFEEPEGLEGKIDELLNQQKKILEVGKVNNVKVSGEILRITYLEKKTIDQHHYWAGIIERLDITEQGEASNLEGVKQTYATGEDEGPIINTGFVYYPLTKTVTLHRKIGGVNDYRLGVFIRKLLRETGIVEKNSSKFTLEVLPDLNKIERLGKANKIKKLEYSFALPKDISFKKSKNRSILGDMFLANRIGGDRIRVSISAQEMNKFEAMKKIKEVLKLGDDVSSLRALAEHGEIEEPLDLLTNKFSDFKDIELKKGKKETITLIIDVISEIFENQRKLISTMYINQDQE